MPTAVKTEQEIYGERVKYIEREFGALKGKTIALVRPLTKAECDQFAWDYKLRLGCHGDFLHRRHRRYPLTRPRR